MSCCFFLSKISFCFAEQSLQLRVLLYVIPDFLDYCCCSEKWRICSHGKERESNVGARSTQEVSNYLEKIARC